jgi:hypothetical protein
MMGQLFRLQVFLNSLCCNRPKTSPANGIVRAIRVMPMGKFDMDILHESPLLGSGAGAGGIKRKGDGVQYFEHHQEHTS